MTSEGHDQNPYYFGGAGVKMRGTNWINYYSTTITQQDTLDAPLDPTNANRYAFAGGDPINNIDPTGMFSFPAFLKLGYKVVSKYFTPLGAVCYVWKATNDSDSSWSDELEDGTRVSTRSPSSSTDAPLLKTERRSYRSVMNNDNLGRALTIASLALLISLAFNLLAAITNLDGAAWFAVRSVVAVVLLGSLLMALAFWIRGRGRTGS